MVEQEKNKISDKAMLSHMVISVSVILACLAALSISACAWFSFQVSSGTNTLTAAKFDLDVTVTSNTAMQSEEVQEDYVYCLTNGEYTAMLANTGDAVNGFCVVKVTPAGQADVIYHTLQIPIGATLELKIKISNMEEAVKVTLIPTIGTSSYYGTTGPSYLTDNQLTVTGTASPQEDRTETEPSSTDKEQTRTIHTVAEGENLTWIAEAYGTTVDAIAELNQIEDKRTIQIGQELIIPAAETE